jgi:hypothetical protein
MPTVSDLRHRYCRGLPSNFSTPAQAWSNSVVGEKAPSPRQVFGRMLRLRSPTWDEEWPQHDFSVLRNDADLQL